MIVDDYGNVAGCRQAVHDFRARAGLPTRSGRSIGRAFTGGDRIQPGAARDRADARGWSAFAAYASRDRDRPDARGWRDFAPAASRDRDRADAA